MRRPRLPVAPRPFRDELLSSWLGRVGCRYGLTSEQFAGCFREDVRGSIGEAMFTSQDIRLWAQICSLDPGRLQRLSLAERYPGRPSAWFLNQGPNGSATPMVRCASVCLACLDADRMARRDAFLRADWVLAEHCVCLVHGCALCDRCSICHWPLRMKFRLREGQARLVCGRCEVELTGRAEEWPSLGDGLVIDAASIIQPQLSRIVSEQPLLRQRLEASIAKLWAPLNDPGAARPVLARWLGAAGWRCPFDVRHAVGAITPLGQLPARWRVVTLAALGDLFGFDLMEREEMPASAARLFRHAMPKRGKRPVSAPL